MRLPYGDAKLCVGCVNSFMNASNLIEFVVLEVEEDAPLLRELLFPKWRRTTTDEWHRLGMSPMMSMPAGHMTVYAALEWLHLSDTHQVLVNHSLLPMVACTTVEGSSVCTLHTTIR